MKTEAISRSSSSGSSGKSCDIETMPLSWRHIWIVFVASLGQLIGTGVATLVGVVIPLLNIISHPELSSGMQGLIGCVDLIGIAVGSVIFGRMSDRYGYLLFFRLCPAIVLVASLVSLIFPDVAVLVVCLFVIGLGIGGEYSLDSDYISELLPVKWRSFMVGAAKTASAFGNIVVAGICWWAVAGWSHADRWPVLMWIVVVIAALMLVCRIWFWQSPEWLERRGDRAGALAAARRFLGSDVTLPAPAESNHAPVPAEKQSMWSFVRNNWRQVMLSGVPWACEGLGVYGIGIFLPVLVMSLGLEHAGPSALPVHHVAASVEITFWISCIILPGFILGLWLIRRKAYIPRLQWMGFWLCAASLIVLLLAYRFHWADWISIAAFMTFELFLNMGPHLVTYVLPPKIYPVAVRGQGSGIAASLGKIGAVVAVFFIPVLLRLGGVVLVLAVSAAVMVAGAVVTRMFAPSVLPEKRV